MPAPLNVDSVRDAPKVLLHDHLDGGLRPATVVELADAAGYTGLPSTDVDQLGGWFLAASHSGSLELYLETFGHTVGVMQSADALVRVAAECAEDLATDGVVYAEVRFAPELHVENGLALDAVVEAVLEGFRVGSARAAERGRRIRVGCLLTAMRHAARHDRACVGGRPRTGARSRASLLRRIGLACRRAAHAGGRGRMRIDS